MIGLYLFFRVLAVLAKAAVVVIVCMVVGAFWLSAFFVVCCGKAAVWSWRNTEALRARL